MANYVQSNQFSAPPDVPFVAFEGSSLAETPSSTEIAIRGKDNTIVQFIGEDFVYNQDGQPVDGTLTEVRHVEADAATVLEDITGLSLSIVGLLGQPSSEAVFGIILAPD